MPSALPNVPLESLQPMSLQSRLDAIAREREVLALARQLAAGGLLEGTELHRAELETCSIEASGVLEIARDRSPPQALVRLGDGSAVPYSPERWNAR